MFWDQSKIVTKNKPIEFLISNNLDKDVQKMFYPLNLMHSLFLSSKYNVRDNFVTPKGKIYNLTKFSIVIFILTYCTYQVFNSDYKVGAGLDDSTVLTAYAIFVISFYYGGFTLLFILSVFHANENVFFILTIQKIFKDIDYKNRVQSFIVWNWLSILSAVGINIFMLFFYYSFINNLDTIDIICDIVFITFDIHLVYAIRIIMLLKEFLAVWSENILEMSYVEENYEKCEIMFTVYKNILRAYNLYKTMYQTLVLFHTADTFGRTLCYMQILIQTLKLPETSEQDGKSHTSVIVSFWLIKDMLLELLQCVHSEKFYIAVEEAEIACIQRLKNSKCPVSQQQLYENVMQLTRTSFSKMTAGGLFYVDASLPVYLLEIITNYVVILLQLAFL